MRIPALLLLSLLLVTQQERAARLAAGGDLDGAERVLRELAAADPDDPDLQYNLGTILLLQGRHDEARPHLERAARALPADVAAPYNLGNTDLEPAHADTALAERDARLRRSIEAYKAALRADPTDEDAKWNLELAWRLLEREEPPPADGGGGGGAGDGPPEAGQRDPAPLPAAGDGREPDMSPEQAEELLRSAQQQELQLQRERLQRPQPPGVIRP
jgi:Ca-activated chloride channel homolog